MLLRTRFPVPLCQIELQLGRVGSWSGELRHRKKNGDGIYVSSSWIFERRDDGLGRITEVSNDATDRRRANDAGYYLASVVNTSDDAIISKDLNGVVTSWNQGAEKLFGYTAAEMVDRTILRLFLPELAQEELSILDRVTRGEQVRHYETVRVTKSGRKLDVSVSVTPILNGDGDVIGAAKIVRDISQDKAYERAMRRTETRQRLAAETGAIGIWSYDLETQTSTWSDRCREMFGLAPDDPIPSYENNLKLIHPDDAPRVDQAFQAALTFGTEFDMDFRIRDAAGTERWVHSKARPQFDHSGAVVEISGAIVDLTRRKRVEDRLVRSNLQLRQFAYAAAHDLQEPLRNIALTVELAKSQIHNYIDEQSEGLLSTAIDNAHQMESMVRGLLKFGEILQEFEKNGNEISDSNAVVADVIKHLSKKVSDTSAHITYGHLPLINIAQKHLHDIFYVLLHNALQHRGVNPPRIHVAADTDDCCSYKFSVSDNGVGIEPQFHTRIFQVFKRLRKTETSGAGMGLALCKRTIEEYGGKIWVESDGRTGSTLVFTLPRIRVACG